jgi:hypothetical protein
MRRDFQARAMVPTTGNVDILKLLGCMKKKVMRTRHDFQARVKAPNALPRTLDILKLFECYKRKNNNKDASRLPSVRDNSNNRKRHYQGRLDILKLLECM